MDHLQDVPSLISESQGGRGEWIIGEVFPLLPVVWPSFNEDAIEFLSRGKEKSEIQAPEGEKDDSLAERIAHEGKPSGKDSSATYKKTRPTELGHVKCEESHMRDFKARKRKGGS